MAVRWFLQRKNTLLTTGLKTGKLDLNVDIENRMVLFPNGRPGSLGLFRGRVISKYKDKKFENQSLQ